MWTWALFRQIKVEKVDIHFSKYLIAHSDVDGYARASMDTKNEARFRWIYSLKRVSEVQFDRICQKIMSYIYCCFEITVVCGSSKTKCNFLFNVKTFIDDNMFHREIIDEFPTHPNQYRSKCCILILFFLLTDFF